MKLVYQWVVAALLLVCANVTAAGDTPKEYSGFLEDNYTLLKPAKAASGEPVMRWVSPKLKTGQYYQIMMVPTQFYPELKFNEKVSEATAKEILKYFDEALGRQLYTVMPVIKNPSKERLASKALNTLKLRVAITAVSTKKSKNIDADNMLSVGLTTAHLKEKDKLVTMSAEYEVVDAATDEVLAVGMRQGFGKPLKQKSSTVKLADFKPILDTWARDAGAFFKALKQ